MTYINAKRSQTPRAGNAWGTTLADRADYRPSSEQEAAGNLDGPILSRIFTACALAYLGIYALEAPIRYGLYNLGKDDLILLRDGLIAVPLCLLFAAQSLQLQLHPAFFVSGALVAFHGLVLMGTIGNVSGVVYGIKILMNLLFGFFIASLLISPGRKTLIVLAMIFAVTALGVCLDKLLVTFPWTGMKAVVGDLNVDVSKDWDITDQVARRVAGFTRSSIAVAAVVPPLAIILISRFNNIACRVLVAVVALGIVALTTQKGSLIAFLPIALILLLPAGQRLDAMRICGLVFMAAAAAIPLLTQHIHMSHGEGVFSTESLYLRVADTWPSAWDWIDRHSMLIFGVGLGGIGGPQQLYAIDDFNPADNIFILLYAYFGVFAIAYMIAIGVLIFRRVTGSETTATTAIAIVAFAFGYGVVLSVIEDQSLSLFLGAGLGALWSATRQGVPGAFATMRRITDEPRRPRSGPTFDTRPVQPERGKIAARHGSRTSA